MKRKAGLRALVLIPLILFSSTLYTGAADEEMVFLALLLPSITESAPGSENCAVGSFAADAVSYAANSQLAIVNSGDLRGDLGQGAMSRESVRSVFTDDRALAKTELTAAELFNLLEALLSNITVDMQTERIVRQDSDFEGFPNISGFRLTYDASAPPYERIVSITLSDGTAVNPNDTQTLYSLAASEELLSGSYGNAGFGSTPAGITLSDALYDYIAQYGREPLQLDWERIKVIGASENNIADMLPTPVLILGAALMIIASVLFAFKVRIDEMPIYKG